MKLNFVAAPRLLWNIKITPPSTPLVDDSFTQAWWDEKFPGGQPQILEHLTYGKLELQFWFWTNDKKAGRLGCSIEVTPSSK